MLSTTHVMHPLTLHSYTRRTLASHMVRLHSEHLASNDLNKSLVKAIDSINHSATVTDIYTRLKPVRILGFVAQRGLTICILLITMIFWVTIFGIYSMKHSVST